MKFTKIAVVIAGLAALVWFTGTSCDARTQKTKGKSRPAATKYLMRGIVRPNCAGLGKLLQEGPADDEAWDAIACNAACLNELSFALMDDALMVCGPGQQVGRFVTEQSPCWQPPKPNMRMLRMPHSRP